MPPGRRRPPPSLPTSIHRRALTAPSAWPPQPRENAHRRRRDLLAIPPRRPADRIAIQFDLAWTGDYNGLINGEANDKTTAAIKAFQRTRKFKETGVLNTQERALLAASAKAKQAQVGWTMVDDAVTGARLGIPTKQVQNKSKGKTGTRWSSAQGQVQVETFRIREPGTTLTSVYEQQKKEPSTRKLEVNFVRPDFFILSGMQNLKKFYVRAEIKDGEVRGMTVLYDQATEPIMDPVVVVMSSAFTPFPGVAGIAQIGPPPKRKVEYGTGIVVSAAGHILTDRQVTDGCNVIVVSGYGDADRQAEDKSTDLALLAGLWRARSRAGGYCRRRPEGSRPHARRHCRPARPRRRQRDLDGRRKAQGRRGGACAAARLFRRRRARRPGPGRRHGRAQDAGRCQCGRDHRAAAGGRRAGAGASAPSSKAQKLAPATGRAGLDAAKASVVRVICVRK